MEINRAEADAQLFDFGKELESAKREADSSLPTCTTDEGLRFYKPAYGGKWEVLLEPKAHPLNASTLQAVVDYIKRNPDALDINKIFVRVVNPETVVVESSMFGPFKQRETHLQTTAIIPDHMFDYKVEPDRFVPYLQSCFCESEDLRKLLMISGNLVDTSEIQCLDDGVSQEVSIRTGAARKSEVAVPSPAILYPFSTFAEVEQPARKFVFRLGSQPLTCALLQADGGAWKLAAVKNIADWLKEHLGEGVNVIA